MSSETVIDERVLHAYEYLRQHRRQPLRQERGSYGTGVGDQITASQALELAKTYVKLGISVHACDPPR